MANYRYFTDLPNGETVHHDSSKVGYREDGKLRAYHNGQWIEVSRKVIYKPFASKHVCDARCMNATGKQMNCECSCGGKNHGKGFSCEVT